MAMTKSESQVEIVDLIRFCALRFRLMAICFFIATGLLFGMLFMRASSNGGADSIADVVWPYNSQYVVEISTVLMSHGHIRPVYPTQNLVKLFQGDGYAVTAIAAPPGANPPSAVVLTVGGKTPEEAQQRAQPIIDQILEKLREHSPKQLPEKRAFELLGLSKVTFQQTSLIEAGRAMDLSGSSTRPYIKYGIMSIAFGIFCAIAAALVAKLHEDYRRKYPKAPTSSAP